MILVLSRIVYQVVEMRMHPLALFLTLLSMFIPAQAMRAPLSCAQGFDLMSRNVIHDQESGADEQGSGDNKEGDEAPEPDCD